MGELCNGFLRTCKSALILDIHTHKKILERYIAKINPLFGYEEMPVLGVKINGVVL